MISIVWWWAEAMLMSMVCVMLEAMLRPIFHPAAGGIKDVCDL